MTQKDKELPDDDRTVVLTEDQIESIAKAKFFEICSIEISAETTDDQIQMAVENMFMIYNRNRSVSNL